MGYVSRVRHQNCFRGVAAETKFQKGREGRSRSKEINSKANRHTGLLNCCVKRVIKMLLIVYLCGCLATMIGVLVAASRFGDRRVSQSLRGLLAVLAGVLWPVLVVAVVELIAIVVLARRMRAANGGQADQAPMQRVELAPVSPIYRRNKIYCSAACKQAVWRQRAR